MTISHLLNFDEAEIIRNIADPAGFCRCNVCKAIRNQDIDVPGPPQYLTIAFNPDSALIDLDLVHQQSASRAAHILKLMERLDALEADKRELQRRLDEALAACAKCREDREE